MIVVVGCVVFLWSIVDYVVCCDDWIIMFGLCCLD